MLRSHGFALKLIVVILAALFCLVSLTGLVLATPEYGVLTVGNDADTSGLSCSSSANCNLRSAIEYANTHGGDYAIIFTPGIHTFTLSSPLVISGNAISITANAGRTVFVNANNNGQAFQIFGSDVVLNNLYIYGSGPGASNIWIGGSAQRVILSNNRIGTYPFFGGFKCDVSPNSYSGVYINSTGVVAPGDARAWIYGNHILCNRGDPGNGIDILTDKVIVGADETGAPHLNNIEANLRNGIRIEGAAASENVIRDAYFAVNQNGIVITGTAYSNQVLTNTITNNTDLGVWLSGSAYYNVVRSNEIYGQGNSGVQLDGGAHDNEIGSQFLASIGGNRIYSNTHEGIAIIGADTRSNAVRGNQIGVDGQNGSNGVLLDQGAHHNVIGEYLVPGEVALGRNVISQNGEDGIKFLWGAHDNTVGGNYIGTNVSGTGVLSNVSSGIAILAYSHDNTIDQNLIGGNGAYGVVIDGSGTSTNTLTLNQIGFNYSASASLPNTGYGLILSNGTFGNLIGGEDLGNFISMNTQSGIFVVNGAHHNSIRNNAVIFNQKYGVLFDGTATANNVISRTTLYLNGLDGIAERNGAVYNVWTQISTYDNAALGINTQAVDESTHIPHPPTLSISSTNRATGVISGKADVTTLLFFTKVELYRVAPDASGYGEGRTFVDSSYTDSSGVWSITDPAFTGCYVAFVTQTSLLGSSSSEFSRSNCSVFLPSIMKTS